MGGFGSGRPGWRPVAEQSLSLSISSLRSALATAKRDGRNSGVSWWARGDRRVATIGYTLAWRDGDPLVVLSYRIGERSIDDPIYLISTPMPRGRVRWWFRCPWCARRVGVLYNPNRDYWRCRWCHHITYQSSCDSDKRVSYARLLDGSLESRLIAPSAEIPDDARGLARAMRMSDYGLFLAMKALDRLRRWQERDFQRWLHEQRKGKPGRPRKRGYYARSSLGRSAHRRYS